MFVKTFDGASRINVSQLPKGTYILKVQSEIEFINNEIHQEKKSLSDM
jgi:hypothetical protein